MEELILTRPTSEYAGQIAEYRQEFLDAGDSMDGTGSLRRMEDTEEYIKVCLDYEDPQNDYLEKYAGHIGYSVRPCERRKGYAKEMLGMALTFCRELGIDNVLVTCADGNVGSEKTILANGGVYEYTIHEPDEDIDLKRFWIKL